MKNRHGKSLLLGLVLLACAAGWLSGCTETREEPAPAAPAGKKVTIKIGIIPEQNLFQQKKRYDPLVDYLGRHAGVVIELDMLSRYGNIIDTFVSNNLDGAFFGSFTGAMALKRLEVEPLVRPEALDGHSTYFGLIFTRKESGIRNGAAMRGKRFVFVDKATTAGWLLPLFYFQEQGIGDYNSWFGETYFSGTHEDAIYDVLDKKADVGAAKNTVFYRLADQDPRILEQLTILASSPDVPENGLFLRSNIDAALKEKIRRTLLRMDQDEPGRRILRDFGAIRFIPTTREDYNPVLEYAARAGIDLANYDYYNK